MNHFEDSICYGLMISAEDKRNYYKAMERKRLQKIYDSLPSIDCTGECHEQCTVAPVGDAEERNIRHVHGEEGIPEPNDNMVCNQKTEDNRCGIHSERPLICRLFGLVKDSMMRCPHGCEPEYWLSDERARELMQIIIRDNGQAESNNRSDSKFLRKVKGEEG